MKRFMSTVAVVTLMCCITIVAPHGNNISTPMAVGRIQGTVKFKLINEGVLPGAKVTIEGSGVRLEADTDAHGNYEIEAPAGMYRISVEHEGFCPGRRSEFQVKAATETVFDFTLFSCASAHGRTSAVDSPYVNLGYIQPYKEELIHLTRATDAPSELMIRYGERSDSAGVLQYRGASMIESTYDKEQKRQVEIENKIAVMVTYDVLTVYADSICFDPQTLQLTAVGEVTLEDGEHRIHMHHMTINFKAKNPISTLITH